MLEKHGYPVKDELKSELNYSSTLCQVVFQGLHYSNLILASAPTACLFGCIQICGRTETDHAHEHVCTLPSHKQNAQTKLVWLARPPLTKNGEQRGKGGLGNTHICMWISLHLACDQCKVWSRAIVSTAPD